MDAGGCGIYCSAGQACCNSKCIDVLNSNANCGTPLPKLHSLLSRKPYQPLDIRCGSQLSQGHADMPALPAKPVAMEGVVN